MTVTEDSVATIYTYTIDSMNRLTEVKKNGVLDETYAYDAAGQMTSKVKKGATPEEDVTTTTAYDILGRVTSVTSDAPTTAHVDDVAYSYYGPSWMRKTATVGPRVTNYVYDGFACVRQITAGVRTDYAVAGKSALW